MIKIEVENGRANIYTPYNPDFVRKIKGVGGSKWNSSEKYWSIPEDAEKPKDERIKSGKYIREKEREQLPYLLR